MENKLSLDEVHHYIDAISEELQELRGNDSSAVTYAHLPTLYAALSDAFGGWTAYGSEGAKVLGVPPKLINHFMKDHRPVPRSDGEILAGRVLSYLRSIEGQLQPVMHGGAPHSPSDTRGAESSSRAPLHIRTDGQWVAVPESNALKLQIMEVARLLDDLMIYIDRSNLPDTERALTEIERRQLIAILETALNILRSPLVEKGFLEAAGDKLKNAADKTADKTLEEAFGHLALLGREAIWKLIKMLPIS